MGLLCLGVICPARANNPDRLPDTSSVKKQVQEVIDWQINHFQYLDKGTPGQLHDYGINAWTNAVLFTGMAEWAKTAGQPDTSYRWLYETGEKSGWAIAENFSEYPSIGRYHADELCMGQFYLRMYARHKEEKMLRATKERLDRIIHHPHGVDIRSKSKKCWSWCDALFMAPPALAHIAEITGDEAYLRFMDEEFKRTYGYLYDREDKLFFRDDSYFDKRERNGQKIYWGRGNGWVAAGLANILKCLPANSPYRPFYENLFREFIPRLASLQHASGFWHASLLDPESYPAPETSATALIAYSIAYGVNSGLLDKKDYLSCLVRAWAALTNAIHENGKLGWIQPIGADPAKVTEEMTAAYGVGAFLMAGSEIYKLTDRPFAYGREVKPFNDGWRFRKAENLPATLYEDWTAVVIPHTWNSEDMQVKKNIFYAGEAYYKKTFVPDDSWADKRVFLRFEGVASVAELFVNGEVAGHHKGGYSAFAIEIGKLLKYGQENTLFMKVNNQARPDVIPVNHTLFGVYGGIYRPVELIVTEKINIAVTDYASPGMYITQTNVKRQSADVSVKIKLENKNKGAETIRLLTTIYEADGKVKARQSTPVTILPQGRQTVVQHFVLKSPHLWQGLEDPYLYKTLTQIERNGQIIDEVTQPLGLRHFELRAADGMYLNGKKVPMYGVCRHQDWWQYGSALTDEQHDTDLAIIRELGATTIRLAHYQQAERIYAKCDSIGFMVWAEIPFVNRVTTQEAANARQQLTELIRQNYNHPSIYIWGLHNEVYTPYHYTVALTAELDDLAKSEDPYRYTASVNGHRAVDQASNLNADVQGINHYFGWYSGEIGDVEKWIEGMEREFPHHKIIFSEYGAEANVDQQEEAVGEVGRYFSQFYPETFATKFHEIQWGIIAKHPYLLASYVWNTFDFATPVNTQGGVEARNMKGLVTFDRKIRKDAYYWYKANWSKEPVLYLTQRRATERENAVTPVTVYSNIGVPQLYVNHTKIEGYAKGTTDVHYIFHDVRLKAGENVIEVKAEHNGKTIEDKIIWNYSPDSRQPDDKPQPGKKTQEHVGL
jgi:beta-galactosidase